MSPAPFPFTPSDFISSQRQNWPLYSDNLNRLEDAVASSSCFTLPDSGWSVTTITLSYRRSSIYADLSKIEAGIRPCFLCSSARPDSQHSVHWGDYEILVNPYPLGPGHLTIPATPHTPQILTTTRVADMLRLATILPTHAVFYNGPRCGASAPDHFHFQAIDRRLVANLLSTNLIPLEGHPGVSVSSSSAPYGFLAIDSDSPALSAHRLFSLIDLLPQNDTDPEPPLNLYATAIPGQPVPRLYVIPRRRHRPTFYGDTPDHILVSPASLEMAGLFVTPLADHTRRLTPSLILDIYRQVAYTNHEILSLCPSPQSR